MINMFDIIDDAYRYVVDDISNMYQWYFIKFYQFQGMYHSLFEMLSLYIKYILKLLWICDSPNDDKHVWYDWWCLSLCCRWYI